MFRKTSITRIIKIFKYFKQKYDQRWVDYQSFFNSEVLPVLENGDLKIPFRESENGIHVFEFSRNHYLGKKSWGYSRNIIQLNNRESRLDYLLNTDYTLGKKLKSFLDNQYLCYFFIREKLIKYLTEYCRRNIKTYDGVINIKIGDDTFTLVKKDRYNDWSDYELVTTHDVVLDDFEVDHKSYFKNKNVYQ